VQQVDGLYLPYGIADFGGKSKRALAVPKIWASTAHSCVVFFPLTIFGVWRSCIWWGFLLRSDEFDLEKFWPEFAGNENSIRRRIVGNAIQYVGGCFFGGLQETFQFDPSCNISSKR
jgi:hypothetical protein